MKSNVSTPGSCKCTSVGPVNNWWSFHSNTLCLCTQVCFGRREVSSLVQHFNFSAYILCTTRSSKGCVSGPVTPSYTSITGTTRPAQLNISWRALGRHVDVWNHVTTSLLGSLPSRFICRFGGFMSESFMDCLDENFDKTALEMSSSKWGPNINPHVNGLLALIYNYGLHEKLKSIIIKLKRDYLPKPEGT
jgi:hypothetical protein